MNIYSYDGPVMEFNRCIQDHWHAVTCAVSESKARNNFAFQFREQTHRLPGTKITIPGKIRMLEDD